MNSSNNSTRRRDFFILGIALFVILFYGGIKVFTGVDSQTKRNQYIEEQQEANRLTKMFQNAQRGDILRFPEIDKVYLVDRRVAGDTQLHARLSPFSNKIIPINIGEPYPSDYQDGFVVTVKDFPAYKEILFQWVQRSLPAQAQGPEEAMAD